MNFSIFSSFMNSSILENLVMTLESSRSFILSTSSWGPSISLNHLIVPPKPLFWMLRILEFSFLFLPTFPSNKIISFWKCLLCFGHRLTAPSSPWVSSLYWKPPYIVLFHHRQWWTFSPSLTSCKEQYGQAYPMPIPALSKHSEGSVNSHISCRNVAMSKYLIVW